MYCPFCGVAVAQGLSYCNQCGAKLNKSDALAKSSEPRPDLLVSAMVATFMFGFAAIAVLMGVMKTVLGLRVEPILALLLLPFLLMLVIEGVLMRLLLRRRRNASDTNENVSSKSQVTNELNAAQARGLPEGRPSVTEHTTRAFHPVYREPTEK